MANDASLTVQHCAFVWRCSKTHKEKSPTFKIHQREFHLQFWTDWVDGSDYRLLLYNKECLSEPFDLSVYLIIGEDSVSHSTTTVRNKSQDIWKSTRLDLRYIAPDFEGKPFLFKIVLYDSAAPSGEKTGHKSVQTPTYLDPKFQLEKLSEDFTKLLEGDDPSPDVQVVCGDRTWKAHKSLLSCRSDVFRAMLHSDMLEGKTGRVEIKDTDPGLFDQFLQHLYTGKLPDLTVDSAIRFYEIGDQYSVAGIKDRCSSFLTDNLAPDNACVILSLADAHHDQAFRQSVISYVLQKKIPLYKEYWADFCKNHPQLAFEIYDHFVQLYVSK